ncbi:MAG: hypothetical protein NVS3B19_12920 [Ginsengibacter sp.]
MKQLKFFSALIIAFAFFLSSCGGNEEKAKTTTTTDSTATTAKVDTTVKSTIDTTSHTVMIVWHKVGNFEKWLTSFEANDSMKMAAGIHNYVIGRSEEDSNLILVATKADDAAHAKAFAKDPHLKAAMQKSGVIGAPSISITNVVYQDNAKNMSPLRSMATYTVKDWDAWRKAFENGRQARADNGLTDRAFGYDVDDNHKVTSVVAINDTAKAYAYWKSDVLKQRMAAAGIVGPVKRRVYRVVKVYSSVK